MTLVFAVIVVGCSLLRNTLGGICVYLSNAFLRTRNTYALIVSRNGSQTFVTFTYLFGGRECSLNLITPERASQVYDGGSGS